MNQLRDSKGRFVKTECRQIPICWGNMSSCQVVLDPIDLIKSGKDLTSSLLAYHQATVKVTSKGLELVKTELSHAVSMKVALLQHGQYFAVPEDHYSEDQSLFFLEMSRRSCTLPTVQ